MNIKSLLVLSILTGGIVSSWATAAPAQIVLEEEKAAQIVAIRNLNATPSLVSGEIANRTPHLIRDIELVIQFHWHWKNEFKPGKEAPGRTGIVKIATEIKPGESIPFRYIPDPPLPDRKDGWFEPEVKVGGFTTVVPQDGMTSR